MKSKIGNRKSAIAFTLIELLVVITIIVVLLALLAPALDKAVYQAQMAVCATNLKGIGTGVQTYAVQFKRSYPNRPEARNSASVKRLSSASSDPRPSLRPFLNINGHLNCPFTPAKADYDGSTSKTIVEVAYNLFFGAQFKTEKGMLRLGDRFVWEDQSFNVLAVDFDQLAPTTFDVAFSSHQDADGTGVPQFLQDGTGIAGTGNATTLSRWVYQPWERPPLDEQFVLDDGSVGRYEQVTWDEAEPTGLERMAKVPNYTNGDGYTGGAGAGMWIHVPKR